MWCGRFDGDLAIAQDRITKAMDMLGITDPRERGRFRSKGLSALCLLVRERADEATKRAFADLMYKAGYHRPW
jgi:hypothetical protein